MAPTTYVEEIELDVEELEEVIAPGGCLGSVRR